MSLNGFVDLCHTSRLGLIFMNIDIYLLFYIVANIMAFMAGLLTPPILILNIGMIIQTLLSAALLGSYWRNGLLAVVDKD